MIKKTLVNGIYDTCPTYGPQVYMPKRQVVVTDGVVSFVDKEHCSYEYNVISFFDVNNIYFKETKMSSIVTRDHDTRDFVYYEK